MARSAHRQYQQAGSGAMMAVQQQPLPPLTGARDDCHYGLRTPLTSPAAISPVSQPDHSPISDGASYYAATPLSYEPRRPVLPSLCLLPMPAERPLCSPPPSASPTEARFPSPASLFSQGPPCAPSHGSGYHSSPRSYLPTAPTSPVHPIRTILPEPMIPRRTEEERLRQERSHRLSITSLLNG
jgi:hypothetical protein